MKKVLLISAIALASLTSIAQTSKSSWLVGGSLGFSSTKQDGSESTASSSVEFSPKIGCFVANNIAVGLDMDLSTQTSGLSTSSQSAFGPFLRYYFPSKAKTAKLFGSFDLSFVNRKLDKSSFNTTRYGLGLGGVFFANKNVGIETVVGYSIENAPEYIHSIRTLGMQIGLQFYLSK